MNIPLIFFTAKPEHEVKERIQDMGIKASHIHKPFSIRALVVKIEEVLDGRGASLVRKCFDRP